MSGGSMNYLYMTIIDSCVGRMEDKILDALMLDLSEVIHDLEWWGSGDIGEEDYRETVRKFKSKWLSKNNSVCEKIIEQECDKLKSELLESLKY